MQVNILAVCMIGSLLRYWELCLNRLTRIWLPDHLAYLGYLQVPILATDIFRRVTWANYSPVDLIKIFLKNS